MAEAPDHADYPQWSNGYHCSRLFRSFRVACRPKTLGLALLGLALTFAWGSCLDFVWVKSGHGIEQLAWDPGRDIAVTTAAMGRTHSLTGEEGDLLLRFDEPRGVYDIYAQKVRLHIANLLFAVIPSHGVGGVMNGIKNSVGGVFAATSWVIRNHYWYSLLFFPVLLLIWSLIGGMICRIAAVTFAREESVSVGEAFAFVRKRYWGGVFLAPITPLLLIVLMGLVLFFGGWVLAIPWFGDVFGGLLFPLALLGGAAIAAILIGLAAGGSLLWPMIAVEGTTSFDAFSTSFHYVYTRPWRSAFYGLAAWVYGSICWLFVAFFARLALWGAHTFVGAGTNVWTDREGIGSKLDALWDFNLTVTNIFGSYHACHTEAVHSVEHVSAGLIAFWVYLVAALVWAFVFSYFFTASTTIYFLLRRAVDLTDYEKIEGIEEFQPEGPGEAMPEAADAATPEPLAPTDTEPTPPPDATETPPPPEGDDSVAGSSVDE